MGGTNRSSLCLYSGPESGDAGRTIAHGLDLGAIQYWEGWQRWFDGPGSRERAVLGTCYAVPRDLTTTAAWSRPLPPATLLTGDAQLKPKKRAAELAEHFEDVRYHVGVIHLPHHGSDGNFNRRLFEDFPYARLALAMVPSASAKHPGPAAINSAREQGVLLHSVDSSAASAITTDTTIAR